MKLTTVWCKYGAESPPELLVAWDEWCMDANYEGYCQEVAGVVAKYPTATYREIELEVDESAVLAAFETSKLKARVSGIQGLPSEEGTDGAATSKR